MNPDPTLIVRPCVTLVDCFRRRRVHVDWTTIKRGPASSCRQGVKTPHSIGVYNEEMRNRGFHRILIISCVYCILAGNYCLNVDRSLNIPSNGLVYVVFVRYLLVSHWSINAVAFMCTVWGDLNRCGIFHGFVCHSGLCD